MHFAQALLLPAVLSLMWTLIAHISFRAQLLGGITGPSITERATGVRHCHVWHFA